VSSVQVAEVTPQEPLAARAPEVDGSSCDCQPRSRWNTPLLVAIALLLLLLAARRSTKEEEPDEGAVGEDVL
jgi:hypothetical protein